MHEKIKNKRIVASIEARMTSSRLPGKVMMESDGLPMIGHLVQRLRQVPSLDEIVVATTTNAMDDGLVSYVEDGLGIRTFRGSEDDVMGRVAGAGQFSDAEVLVEITGDCPIIDADTIEQLIWNYFTNDVDYASMRGFPDGMGAQVYALSVLEKSCGMTDDPLDREHVTRHIRNSPDLFSPLTLVAPPELYWPDLRLTLDEQADFEVIDHLIKHFGPDNRCFSLREAIEILTANPDWIVNSDIVGTVVPERRVSSSSS